MLTKKRIWREKFRGIIGDWREWLGEGEDGDKVEKIRSNTYKGVPIGSDKFIKGLDRIAGRVLHYRPIGRPKKINK